MRKTNVIILVVLGLVLGLSASALGQAGTGQAAARQQAAQDRVAELKTAREGVLHNFSANRTAILDAYHASLNATRASFLENKTAVLAACNATREAFTNNSESNETPEHAKCVKDGLKPLIEKAHADNAAARDTAREALKAERAKGLSAWGKSFRDANEHYRAKTGEAPAGA